MKSLLLTGAALVTLQLSSPGVAEAVDYIKCAAINDVISQVSRDVQLEAERAGEKADEMVTTERCGPPVYIDIKLVLERGECKRKAFRERLDASYKAVQEIHSQGKAKLIKLAEDKKELGCP